MLAAASAVVCGGWGAIGTSAVGYGGKGGRSGISRVGGGASALRIDNQTVRPSSSRPAAAGSSTLPTTAVPAETAARRPARGSRVLVQARVTAA